MYQEAAETEKGGIGIGHIVLDRHPHFCCAILEIEPVATPQATHPFKSIADNIETKLEG